MARARDGEDDGGGWAWAASGQFRGSVQTGMDRNSEISKGPGKNTQL